MGGIKKLRYGIFALGMAAVMFAALLLGRVINYDRTAADLGELRTVSLSGEYSEEGGPWQPLTQTTDFTNLTFRDITVRGHLSVDIPAGQRLFFIVDNIWLSVRVNGEELYSIGKPAEGGRPPQTGGKLWASLVSPGITTKDTVELRFGNVYWNGYYIQFRELLGGMCTGSERAMMYEAVNREAGLFFFGAAFLLVGIVSLFGALAMAILRAKGALSFLWLACAALFSGLWFITLSPALALLIPYPVTVHLLYSLSVQGIAVSVLLLVSRLATGWRRAVILLCEGAALLTVLVSVVMQAAGMKDVYDAINYFMIVDMVCAALILVCLGHETFRLKNREAAGFLRTLLPLVACAVIEMINGYLQFCEAAIFLGLGLLAFLLMEAGNLLLRMKRVRDSEKRALALENELTQSKIATMLSQIQPHFLYNALDCIGELCVIDPLQAERAVTKFSMFLRGNLDALSSPGTIPFELELSHTKHYLELEQMRFDTRLRVVYQIGPSQFRLPSLTLQPIVENAVRYGVTKRPAGGTVTVSTAETERVWTITVEDDGMGFDPGRPAGDGRSHVGIQNVRQRLEGQVGGDLTLTSEPGVGTTAVITIPKLKGG